MIKAGLFEKSIITRPKLQDHQLYDGRIFWANNIEKAVIDSSFLTRLQGISQLGLVYKVYSGATHTRFAHSLSAAEIAVRMFDTLIEKYRAPLQLNQDEIDYYRLRLSLKLLMHDTGHGPHSHEFEDACEHVGLPFDHELITEQYLASPEFNELLNREGYDFQNARHAVLDRILEEIKDSMIDADKMDYHLHDAYYCGIPTRFDRERIISKLELVETDTGLHLAINRGGIDALEEFLSLRTRLHHTIYCNPRTLVYRKHLALFLGEYFAMQPEALQTISTYKDNRVDLLVEENAHLSRHAAAIHTNTPYSLLLDSKGDIEQQKLPEIYKTLVTQLGEDNVIMLNKKINAPGTKLAKKPFYVLHPSFADAIDILQLKPQIAAQKDEIHTFIYVNPDLLGAAKCEIGKLLP